jgi:hypothetical protein
MINLKYINNIPTLEQGTEQLFDAIMMITQEIIPQAKIHPHTKHWWNNELNTLQKAKNHASTAKYRWCGLLTHLSHIEYKLANKTFVKAIEKAKADHWSNWIKHIRGDDIWLIHHYMKATPTNHGKQ